MSVENEVEELANTIRSIKSDYWYSNKDAKISNELKEEHRHIAESLIKLGYSKATSNGLVPLDENNINELFWIKAVMSTDMENVDYWTIRKYEWHNFVKEICSKFGVKEPLSVEAMGHIIYRIANLQSNAISQEDSDIIARSIHNAMTGEK